MPAAGKPCRQIRADPARAFSACRRHAGLFRRRQCRVAKTMPGERRKRRSIVRIENFADFSGQYNRIKRFLNKPVAALRHYFLGLAVEAVAA